MTDLASIMEVTVSRAFKVNLGNFENGDSHASVKVTVPIDTDVDELATQLTAKIDALQAPDLNMFWDLTTERDTIVYAMFGSKIKK